MSCFISRLSYYFSRCEYDSIFPRMTICIQSEFISKNNSSIEELFFYIFSNISSINTMIISKSNTVEMENTPIILNTTIPTKNKLKRNHCLKLEKICDKNTSPL